MFDELTFSEQNSINGGGVAAAIVCGVAGAAIGFAAGSIVGGVACLVCELAGGVDDDQKGNMLLACSAAGAAWGAKIGASAGMVTPIP